jgi:hypothetical protein
VSMDSRLREDGRLHDSSLAAPAPAPAPAPVDRVVPSGASGEALLKMALLLRTPETMNAFTRTLTMSKSGSREEERGKSLDNEEESWKVIWKRHQVLQGELQRNRGSGTRRLRDEGGKRLFPLQMKLYSFCGSTQS